MAEPDKGDGFLSAWAHMDTPDRALAVAGFAIGALLSALMFAVGRVLDVSDNMIGGAFGVVFVVVVCGGVLASGSPWSGRSTKGDTPATIVLISAAGGMVLGGLAALPVILVWWLVGWLLL